jgi:hypothetical protein
MIKQRSPWRLRLIRPVHLLLSSTCSIGIRTNLTKKHTTSIKSPIYYSQSTKDSGSVFNKDCFKNRSPLTDRSCLAMFSCSVLSLTWAKSKSKFSNTCSSLTVCVFAHGFEKEGGLDRRLGRWRDCQLRR